MCLNHSTHLALLTCGREEIKSWAFDILAACIISSSVTPGRPRIMFSFMVMPNRIGSWDTTPMLFLNQWMLSWRTSSLSRVIWSETSRKNREYKAFNWFISDRHWSYLSLISIKWGWQGIEGRERRRQKEGGIEKERERERQRKNERGRDRQTDRQSYPTRHVKNKIIKVVLGFFFLDHVRGGI